MSVQGPAINLDVSGELSDDPVATLAQFLIDAWFKSAESQPDTEEVAEGAA